MTLSAGGVEEEEEEEQEEEKETEKHVQRRGGDDISFLLFSNAGFVRVLHRVAGK